MLGEAARACLAATTAALTGHEAFYIVAPQTMMSTPSAVLRERFLAEVPVRTALDRGQGFDSCAQAERLLGWTHELAAVVARTEEGN